LNIVFDRSFSKSIDHIASASIKKKLETIIFRIETAKSLYDIPNLKKMEGYKSFYRIRMGEYRLGFELLEDNSILLIVIAHRKDIYRVFP